ncbi:MAG: hypothetical protein ABJA75_04620 [Bradyrhizobium sp.]
MYEAKRCGKGGLVVHAPEIENLSLVPDADPHHAGFAETAMAELVGSAASYP